VPCGEEKQRQGKGAPSGGGREETPGKQIRQRELRRLWRVEFLQLEVAIGTAVNCRAVKQSSARGGRKREFSEDLFVILEIYRDLLVKTNLTTVLRLKHKCDQNESCTTFQALQLCFKV
jgi:hypothetical protein